MSRDKSHAPASMLRKIADIGAVIGSRALKQLALMVVIAIAARVLSKELLGVWAVIYVVIQFGVLVSDTGISTFIVRNREMSRRLFATSFTLGVLLSAAMAALLCVASIPIVSIFEFDGYQSEFLVAAAAIVILTINGLLQAKLRRERRFRMILISDSIASAVMLTGATWMLLDGGGLWAMILPTILSAIAGASVCAMSTGIPKPSFDREDVSEIFDYSLGLVGFSSVYFWSRNADQLLVGRFLGPAPLGIYSLAIRIMMMPLSQLNASVQTVALPYLAPHQDDNRRLRDSFRRLTCAVGMLATLPMIWIWLEREFVVNLMLGEGWEEVSQLLLVLVPLGIFQSLVNPMGMAFQIRGKNNRFFVIGLIHSLVTIFGFAIGIMTGSLHGVVIAYFIANVIVAPISVGQAMQTIDGRFRDWVLWTAPLYACLPLCWFSSQLLPDFESPWASVAATVAITTATVSPIYVSLFRRNFGRLNWLPRLGGQRATAQSST